MGKRLSPVRADVCLSDGHTPEVLDKLFLTAHRVHHEIDRLVQFVQFGFATGAGSPLSVAPPPLPNQLNLIVCLELCKFLLCILKIRSFHGTLSSSVYVS